MMNMQGLLGINQQPQELQNPQMGLLSNGGYNYEGLLDQYKNLNFVQRARNPEDTKIYTPQGNPQTHRMAAEVDENGNWYAFPTIVRKQDGTMHVFDDNFQAMDYALKTGEFIPFQKDKNKALDFAENGYKHTPSTQWMLK